MYPKVVLDPKKAANVIYRHPWIFSGAIISMDENVTHGSLIQVEDPTGRILGTGTFSATSSIAVRVLSFTGQEINKAWLVERLQEADEKRQLLGFGKGTDTTGYRVAFGESDCLPGLIVDRFDDVLVFQIATAGMDGLRKEIVEALEEVFDPRSIYERSDMPSRHEEKLEDEVGLRFGEAVTEVNFKENGLKFVADVATGQKTGFFFDQRDTRTVIQILADGRKVLNIFSYTGAASVAAIMGGALSVHNIDGSNEALEMIEKNAKLNKIVATKMTTENADAFAWLGEHKNADYDMVIVDPPALIKSRRDIEEGKKAYHFVNRAAMRLVKDGGIFVTSSCSHYFNEEDFAFTLRRASVQNEINLSILQTIRQAPDHPLSVYFPEAAYLKTFVCHVEKK